MGSDRIAAAVCGLCLLACASDENRAGSAPIHASATAYCQSGTTRSGEQTRRGVVAADPRVLPLRTKVRIDAPHTTHDGVYTVLDTGSAVKGRVVDIYMPDCRAAREFGRRQVVVYVLEWGPADRLAQSR
jgi:3D (Asp-Asp-Asp) domain-containing protein